MLAASSTTTARAPGGQALEDAHHRRGAGLVGGQQQPFGFFLGLETTTQCRAADPVADPGLFRPASGRAMVMADEVDIDAGCSPVMPADAVGTAGGVAAIGQEQLQPLGRLALQVAAE